MTEKQQEKVRVGPFDILRIDRDRLSSLADLNERTFAAEVRVALRFYMQHAEERLSADG
jgi:hypothetical protein